MFRDFMKIFGLALLLAVLLSCNTGVKQTNEKLSATAFEQTLKEKQQHSCLMYVRRKSLIKGI